MFFENGWSLQDNTVFYKHISGTAKIENDTIAITHEPFTNRQLQIIEHGESYLQIYSHHNTADTQNNIRNTIIEKLKYDSPPTKSDNCDGMYKTLCAIQRDTGMRFTIREINDKYARALENWIKPLRNICLSGYFTECRGQRPGSVSISSLFDIDTEGAAMTNIDSKNWFLFKALKQYVMNRESYWSDESKYHRVPSDLTVHVGGIDNMKEFRLWLVEMIKAHGNAMVSFADSCALRAANTHAIELSYLEGHGCTFVHNIQLKSQLELLYNDALLKMTVL
ncbi:hypothetical protein GGI07_004835 [Coemansia sp. Benny D115]|nr:hypothetical protein GGI07_004835 [Coemansia sp. Benny D115]